MNTTVDVLVVGGGVIGLCSAYYLAEDGWEVSVVEQDDICAGCSCGNAGLIVPSHSTPLAAPGVMGRALRWMFDPESPFFITPRLDPDFLSWLWQFRAACNERAMRETIPVLRDLQRASLELYEGLAAVEDLDFGYQQAGLLRLYAGWQGFEEGLEEAQTLSEYGLDYEVLGVTEIRQFAPNVSSNIVGGIYHPEDAHLIPDDLLHGLARVLEGMGVQIRPSTEVLGFRASGRKVSTVETTRGPIEAKQIVLAAGAWLPRLVSDLAIDLPIQAAKGYSLSFKRPADGLSVPLYLSEGKVAVTPMGQTLRFGGTLELAGLDFSIDRRRVDAIQKTARSYMCGTEGLELIEIWRGLRPCTPDGLPIISRANQYENLIIAGGHATLGMSLGPITGRLVSQIAGGQGPTIDVQPLRLERFQGKKEDER